MHRMAKPSGVSAFTLPDAALQALSRKACSTDALLSLMSSRPVTRSGKVAMPAMTQEVRGEDGCIPTQPEKRTMINFKLASALTSCILLAACASDPKTGNFETTRTGVGLAVGTVGGALVGAAMGDGSAVIKGAVLGAAAGGGLGYAWEKRHKEMQTELASTDFKVEKGRIADGQQVLVICAPADVFFKIGSADIAPESYPALSKLAKSLKSQNYKVGITGHTDNSGSPDQNNRLSYDRARSVAAYLTAAGVPYQNLYVRGAGSKEPKADNATPMGRADNRRVEIVLSKDMPKA